MENSEGSNSSENDIEVMEAASSPVYMKPPKQKNNLLLWGERRNLDEDEDNDEYCYTYTPDFRSIKKFKDFTGQCSSLPQLESGCNDIPQLDSSEEDLEPEVILAASTLVSWEHEKPKNNLQDEDEYCCTTASRQIKNLKDHTAGQCSSNDMIPQVKKLQGLIGECSKPFHKRLSKSDVGHDQNQVLLIRKDVETCIVPLLNKEENPSEGVQVTVYDWNGKEYPMMFKIHTKGECVLTSGWNKFCKDHRLSANQHFITLWMFRHVHTRKPCFVIRYERTANLD